MKQKKKARRLTPIFAEAWGQSQVWDSEKPPNARSGTAVGYPALIEAFRLAPFLRLCWRGQAL